MLIVDNHHSDRDSRLELEKRKMVEKRRKEKERKNVFLGFSNLA